MFTLSHLALQSALLCQGTGQDIAALADTQPLQAPWWPLTEAWLTGVAQKAKSEFAGDC